MNEEMKKPDENFDNQEVLPEEKTDDSVSQGEKKSKKGKLITGLVTVCVIGIAIAVLIICLAAQGNLKYVLNADGQSYSVYISEYDFDTWNNEKDVVIPEEYKNLPVTRINSNGFSLSDTLVSVTIPESVTVIGGEAFSNCGSLEKLSIPDTIIEIEAGITGGAFDNSPKLQFNEYSNALYLGNDDNPYVVLVKAKDKEITSCEIHKDTKVIAPDAFRDCTLLKGIFIPGDVRTICSSAFRGCTSLLEVSGCAGLIKIGTAAFSGCESLLNVMLATNLLTGSESKLTHIESVAFGDCKSLSGIVIPKSVVYIGSQAFNHCDSLTDVFYTGTEEEWAKIEISDSNTSLTDATIHFN